MVCLILCSAILQKSRFLVLRSGAVSPALDEEWERIMGDWDLGKMRGRLLGC